MANIIINLTDSFETKPKAQRFTYKDIAMPLTNKFDANFDLTAIRQSLHNIFSWKQGQRILDPEFGNILNDYVYETINSLTMDNMKIAIEKMLRYEPRIVIIDIDIQKTNQMIDRSEININITYDVPLLAIKGINDTLTIT